jgi:hypothetical protein
MKVLLQVNIIVGDSSTGQQGICWQCLDHHTHSLLVHMLLCHSHNVEVIHQLLYVGCKCSMTSLTAFQVISIGV